MGMLVKKCQVSSRKNPPYQGGIQEIEKEGAERRQARAARGSRGHACPGNFEI